MTAPRLTYRAPYDDKGNASRGLEKTEGRSGAYVIRERASKRVLYVGESHTGKLRGTIQRHFQNWKGKTAGHTYDRRQVEVAWRVTKDGPSAVELQDRWIASMRPRDNVLGQPSWLERLTGKASILDALKELIPF